MVGKPALISNTITVTFPTKTDIRKHITTIEDLVRKGTNFTQPILFPIPDEMDPSAPRIIFGTDHKYSQLVISQNAFSLNMMYSPDFQHDFAKCESYINKHTPILYALVDKIVKKKAYFSGLSSTVLVEIKAGDQQVINHVSELYSLKCDAKDLFDLDIKFTYIVGGKYFRNIQVQNVRMWPSDTVEQTVIPFPSKKAKHRGIQLVQDFNDRYSFNEVDKYSTSWAKGSNIIKQSFQHLNSEIVKVNKLRQLI